MTAMSNRKIFIAPKQDLGVLGKILSVLALVGGIVFYMSADKGHPEMLPVGIVLLAVGLLYWFAMLWLNIYETCRRNDLTKARVRFVANPTAMWGGRPYIPAAYRWYRRPQ